MTAGLVYGRYMDDFYIIHSDKLLLRQILKEIEAYIKPLGLRLNGKTQILPLKNGIDFLGFHTYLTQTGKVVRKVRAKSIQKLNDEQAAEAKKDKTIAEQADTIELLKGCIMELADVVYGDGGEVTA